MEITFDPHKDAHNIQVRGISLADAECFEWEEAVAWKDSRQEYGETRMVALGYIGDRLHVFVDRDGFRRIISLRKASTREIKRYAET